MDYADVELTEHEPAEVDVVAVELAKGRVGTPGVDPRAQDGHEGAPLQLGRCGGSDLQEWRVSPVAGEPGAAYIGNLHEGGIEVEVLRKVVVYLAGLDAWSGDDEGHARAGVIVRHL